MEDVAGRGGGGGRRAPAPARGAAALRRGRASTGRSHVDASRLTGEPVPVTRRMPGVRLLERQPQPRGSAHASAPPRPPARASTPGSWSWSAPRRRASRRSSGWPTGTPSGSPRSPWWSAPLPISLSGDPARVLAVLVVATPCPLILATPVAVIGGINRAARRGIIFRHGTALEQLGRVDGRRLRQDRHAHDRPARGRPGARGRRRSTEEELLRLAGGVEQGSGHLLARTLVQEAERARRSRRRGAAT